MLKNRKDRKGNQKLTVTNIYLRNKENTIVSEVSSGENIPICLDYNKKTYVNQKLFTIVIQFKNEDDIVVTTITTDELGTKFTNINGQGIIQLRIPKVQFREGKYTLNYMISERESLLTPHRVIDYLADAFTLNVTKIDYWKSGTYNRPKGFIQESSIILE